MSRSSLQRAYGIWAPIYDRAVRGFSEPLRKRSLRQIPQDTSCQVLIDGIGTGLDIPFLPAHCSAVGIDLTHAMLRRAQDLQPSIPLARADAESLPFADASFDFVVMHLILAVVPHAEQALAEASRVLKPHGRILLLDKFLRPGQKAWLRRGLGRLAGAIATHTDITFEDVLAGRPELHCVHDEPAAIGGWFRLITLEKQA
ncbi:phosphatidylethanolamine N-methyltransferase [Acidithiobacillus marinus]|uniref:Phosphatidylethanolamine N-methyltransferase n=1 Tax=Acidithiobacillus marinus TaxID=187490 RepID=A0A2I1DLV4_9PROT|nr:phosphatidylethanolamine N-methyltransferase [Acidithiobacillus marinus]